MKKYGKDIRTGWTLFVIVLIGFIVFLCTSCKEIRYVPVESVKTEYRDNFVRDSIFRYDSIFVKEKGDTILIERYKYMYRDKMIRDSVYLNDTIRVPYPVEVQKEVNRITSWQNFQIWCGRIGLGIILLLGVICGIRKRLW